MATAVAPSPTAPCAPLEHDWTANQQIRWYRSPLPMAQLRALSQRRNLRPLLHVLGFILMLTATGTVVVLTHRHLSWPWLIPALFLHGTVFRTLRSSAPDHCRGTPSEACLAERRCRRLTDAARGGIFPP